MRKYTVIVCLLALIALSVPLKTSSAMSKLGPALLTMKFDPMHENADLIPVLIRLQKPCVIHQTTFGGKYITTTHELNNPTNIQRIVAFSSVLRDQQDSAQTILEISNDIEINGTYQLTTNTLKAVIPRNTITAIAELECVSKVFYEYPIYPQRWHSREPLNCWSVYDGETDLDGDICLDPEGRQIDGTGILCSVTDTGLDYTHPDFGAQKKPEGKKVVISHDFAEPGDDCQEIVGNSHGTCCAGIIAADGRGKEKGIAPKALLAGYKIAGPGGGLSGDVLATWEIMVKEGVDVSNNSYGAPRGYSTMREAENNAVLAGVSVIASQGNHGTPGPKLPIACGSTSSPPNVIAVGATQDYASYSKIVVCNSNDMEDIGKEYKAIWSPTKKEFNNYGVPLGVVDCRWGHESDFNGVDLEGKVVLIQRGPSCDLESESRSGVRFSDKLSRAYEAGAVLVILYNHFEKFMSLSWNDFSANTPKEIQDHFLPCLEISESQGNEMRDILHAGNEWDVNQPNNSQNELSIIISKASGYGNITSFTSQGPTINGTLKPDVCAPGERIRSTYPMWAAGKTDYYGNKFGDIPYTDDFGGTSAAGPFVCGVACLIRQAKPEWSPFEVKRAIMNTSKPLRRYTGNDYIPLLSQGMGRANAFDACMTDVLIQPPSVLILESSGKINIDDQPKELLDRAKKAKLPVEIRNSMIAFKIYNYDKDDGKTLKLSYEVNSRQADDIKVIFTSDAMSIPKSSKDSPHSHAWLGVDIERPSRLTGGTNDIFIWFEDEKTGQRWHTGICVYSGQPDIQGRDNTYVGYVDYSNLDTPPVMTPNGDGISDDLEVNYTMTNGAFNQWMVSQRHHWPYYSNFSQGIDFLIKDFNDDTWQKIHSVSMLEPGEHSFSWNGLKENGEYLLPDGEWFLGIETSDIDIGYNEYNIFGIVDVPRYITLPKSRFQISESLVPPLPWISAHSLPVTPGMGSEFLLGIYVEDAVDLKSVQFDLILPGLADIAKYKGYEAGELMRRDSEDYASQSNENSQAEQYIDISHESGSDQIWVSVQRPYDGVSGDGWLVYLKFLPISANYLDISFDDLIITYFDENTSEEKETIAFFRTSFLTIDDKYYEPADFNRDGEINLDDMDIITKSLNSKRGDELFNWRCDLNRDQVVDLKDMVLFAQVMK